MKLQVIIGSIRQGRVSDRLAQWVANEANSLPGTTVELVDLKDYELPLFDEAISPQFNPDRRPHPTAKKWLDKLAEADAYVLVTPEYNRATTGALKNSLDYVAYEMEKKPVGLVAHGSSGGAQAVADLRLVITGLLAVTAPSATYVVAKVKELFDENGQLIGEADDIVERRFQPALHKTLEQVKWYSDALATARERETAATI